MGDGNEPLILSVTTGDTFGSKVNLSPDHWNWGFRVYARSGPRSHPRADPSSRAQLRPRKTAHDPVPAAPADRAGHAQLV